MEQKKQKLMIFLAGELRHQDNIRKKIAEESFDFYAADGGYRYALNLDLPLKKILGDFDSVDKPEADCVLVFPTEKDETDAELALQLGIQEGYREIWLVAPFGGRADHSVANLALLELALAHHVKVILYDGENFVQMLPVGTYSISDEYRYVSFFSVDATAELSLTDFKYPLNHYELKRNKPLGISNEPCGPHPTVNVHKGTLLCVCIENIQEDL